MTHNWPMWPVGSVPSNVLYVFEGILDGLLDGSLRIEQTRQQRSGLATSQYILHVVDTNARMLGHPLPPVQITTTTGATGQTGAPGSAHPAISDLGVITEPVIGFRDFVLRTSIEGPILMSRNDHPWTYRKRMRALCAGSNSGQPFSKHDAPDEKCQCGIYAYARPDDPNLKGRDVVWGEIAMWGEVLICDKGYRSQFAYPLSLFIRDNGTRNVRYLADELAELYGVPCFVVAEREGKTAQEVMGELIENLYREANE